MWNVSYGFNILIIWFYDLSVFQSLPPHIPIETELLDFTIYLTHTHVVSYGRDIHDDHNPHEALNDEDGSSQESPATNKPQIISQGANIPTREGDSLSLPCEVKDLGKSS